MTACLRDWRERRRATCSFVLSRVWRRSMRWIRGIYFAILARKQQQQQPLAAAAAAAAPAAEAVMIGETKLQELRS